MQLSELMAMAGQMREKLAEAQANVERLQVTAEAGGGMVKVTLDGRHHLRELTIDPTICRGPDDLPLVTSLVRSAINQAVGRLAEQLPGQLGKAAADLGLDPSMLGGLAGGAK